jgi:hypothetical protein
VTNEKEIRTVGRLARRPLEEADRLRLAQEQALDGISELVRQVKPAGEVQRQELLPSCGAGRYGRLLALEGAE